jgi:hypothetical protein
MAWSSLANGAVIARRRRLPAEPPVCCPPELRISAQAVEPITRLTMLIWARCAIVGQGDHHEDQRDDQRSIIAAVSGCYLALTARA